MRLDYRDQMLWVRGIQGKRWPSRRPTVFLNTILWHQLSSRKPTPYFWFVNVLFLFCAEKDFLLFVCQQRSTLKPWLFFLISKQRGLCKITFMGSFIGLSVQQEQRKKKRRPSLAEPTNAAKAKYNTIKFNMKVKIYIREKTHVTLDLSRIYLSRYRRRFFCALYPSLGYILYFVPGSSRRDRQTDSRQRRQTAGERERGEGKRVCKNPPPIRRLATLPSQGSVVKSGTLEQVKTLLSIFH
jgi:hypothetical protein